MDSEENVGRLWAGVLLVAVMGVVGVSCAVLEDAQDEFLESVFDCKKDRSADGEET